MSAAGRPSSDADQYSMLERSAEQELVPMAARSSSDRAVVAARECAQHCPAEWIYRRMRNGSGATIENAREQTSPMCLRIAQLGFNQAVHFAGLVLFAPGID
jgi:hypothetical protein